MSSQDLENPYQITVMNEPENMNLEEESQLTPSAEEMQEGDFSEASEKDGKSHYKKDTHQTLFEAFLHDFENESNLEMKLQRSIDFMEVSISQGGSPHFRHFWEARKLSLPLFRENISPAIRSHLWHRYSELSKEARRLKDMLDEQSAFAVEQIEIAINALEHDIENFEEQYQKMHSLEDGWFPQSLNHHRQMYQDWQRQLNVLNVQASRINALRKELLKTEMRIRQKNKFFQRLSAAGDKVFPRRKELIKQISHQFTEDVNSFIQSHFQQENLDQESALYMLREEIKILQGLAKILTLNTSAFTQTRLSLSGCWDQIKVKEKERKKEWSHQRALCKENADIIEKQVQETKEAFEQGSLTVAAANSKLDEIGTSMRQVDLGRDDVKKLRDALGEMRKLVQEKVRAEEDVRHQHENEKARQRKEKHKQLRDQVDTLVRQADSYEAEKLTNERDTLLTEINEASLTKGEKQELERLLKPLKDVITERKEKALLDLSEDDRQAIQQLKEILRQRKERRQEIKNQLESYRKLAGSSSLDFEKAMIYNEQINEEKERLEKSSHGIKEIEDKIAKLQAK